MWHNLARLARYRGLIQSLVVRDLKARYRGSVLGFFWSFVNPLLLLLIYSFVFATFLENRDPNTQPYSLFMFCGILPWTWFASSLNESAVSLIAGGNLIKKVLFPAEILPIVAVVANMVHFFLGLTILGAFLIYYQRAPDLAGLPWFPVVIVFQLIFTLGLALFLSALSVHFRDVKDLLSNLLTLWFFATPIIYPWTMASLKDPATGELVPWFWWVLNLNPFAHFAISYQEILFYPGPFGHLMLLLVTGGVSIVTFLAGYWVFDRLRDSFAEAV